MSLDTPEENERLARIAYFLSVPGLIEGKALEQAEADKSDPFTYARVRSHYRNGTVIEPDDYRVEWGKEIRTAHLGDQKVEFAVKVPRNLKRP